MVWVFFWVIFRSDLWDILEFFEDFVYLRDKFEFLVFIWIDIILIWELKGSVKLKFDEIWVINLYFLVDFID